MYYFVILNLGRVGEGVLTLKNIRQIVHVASLVHFKILLLSVFSSLNPFMTSTHRIFPFPLYTSKIQIVNVAQACTCVTSTFSQWSRLSAVTANTALGEGCPSTLEEDSDKMIKKFYKHPSLYSTNPNSRMPGGHEDGI